MEFEGGREVGIGEGRSGNDLEVDLVVENLLVEERSGEREDRETAAEIKTSEMIPTINVKKTYSVDKSDKNKEKDCVNKLSGLVIFNRKKDQANAGRRSSRLYPAR